MGHGVELQGQGRPLPRAHPWPQVEPALAPVAPFGSPSAYFLLLT